MSNTKLITFGGIAAGLLLFLTGKKGHVSLANSLYSKWSGVKEYESSFRKTLEDMWRILGYDEEKVNRYISGSIPWSAAFISYVMIKGGKTDFPKSAAHTCIASKVKSGAYKGYDLKRVYDYSPNVGDIIIKNRAGAKSTFDSFKCGDPSHSEVVVKVSKNNITSIGGNVGNTISKTDVRTDSTGKILSSTYFAIIKVN